MSEQTPDANTGRDIGAEIQALADAFNVNASIGYLPHDKRWFIGFNALHVVQYGGALWHDKAKGTREWDVAATRLTRYGTSLADAFDKILAVIDGDKPYMLCNTEMGFMSGGYDDVQPVMRVYEGRTQIDQFDYFTDSVARVRTFLDTHYPRPLPPANS